MSTVQNHEFHLNFTVFSYRIHLGSQSTRMGMSKWASHFGQSLQFMTDLWPHVEMVLTKFQCKTQLVGPFVRVLTGILFFNRCMSLRSALALQFAVVVWHHSPRSCLLAWIFYYTTYFLNCVAQRGSKFKGGRNSSFLGVWFIDMSSMPRTMQ